MSDLTERLENAQSTCEHGPVVADPDGSLARAEADVAMADNIDNISPAQEQRIRAALGAEMGLAPSQVDGWRDIYVRRASSARRRLKSARAMGKEAKKDACTNVPKLEAELAHARQAVRYATIAGTALESSAR